MSEDYRLRPHHLLNLVIGAEDRYANLEEGLRKTRVKVPIGEIRIYTDEDALVSKQFYHNLASNPDTNIEIVAGIDDRCKLCSNYSIGCTAFSEKNLKLEDRRSLEKFPELNIGDRVKVSDVLISPYQN